MEIKNNIIPVRYDLKCNDRIVARAKIVVECPEGKLCCLCICTSLTNGTFINPCSM